MKTEIEFKFLMPCGIQLDGYGNFSPEFKKVLSKDAPKSLGNVWVDGMDLDQVYKVTLPDETPRELPEHISRSKDEAVRTAFHIKQAELAADRHEGNNKVRDELAALQRRGRIKIVADSFMDALAPPEPPPDKPAPKESKS